MARRAPDRIAPAEYAAAFALRDSGDPAWPAARDRIVLANLGLAGMVGRKYLGRFGNALDLDDMVSAGVVGLIRAAEAYDPGRGVAFSTYAALWARQAIVEECGRPINPSFWAPLPGPPGAGP